MTFGQRTGTAPDPQLLPSYNLGTASTAATLKVQTIQAGVGVVLATTSRDINFNNGTIQNYDGTTDLTINGTSPAAQDLINVKLSGTTDHTFSVDSGRTITVGTNAIISGGSTSALTKSGAGTLVLNGANTYAGPTLITGGNLQLSGSGSISASPTISIGNGSALIYNRTGSFTYAGIISGSGKVTKIGTATQTLTGLNTYTGDTTVSAGVLVVNGSAIPDSGKLIIDGTGKVDLTNNETVNTLFLGTTGKAAGVYGSTASSAPLGNQDDTRFSGTGTLTVTTNPAADPYPAWASANGLTGANNGPTMDPDNDSVSNLLEFVLGGQPNPANANSNSTGLLPVATSPSGNLVFTFTRNAQSKTAPIALTIQVGTDLVTFPAVYTVGSDTASSGVGVTVTPSGGDDIVTLTIARSPDTKKFARLNAVYIP